MMHLASTAVKAWRPAEHLVSSFIVFFMVIFVHFIARSFVINIMRSWCTHGRRIEHILKNFTFSFATF